MIYLHLVYNSRSGVKPDHSGSGGLSVIANGMAVWGGAETCNEYLQKLVQAQPWIYVGKNKRVVAPISDHIQGLVCCSH